MGGRARFGFNVTKDAGLPKQRIDWPSTLTPTLAATTTMSAVSTLIGQATASLSETSGPVLSKTAISAARLAPNTPVSLVWATVVGNRVNCSGTCWSFVSVPLGSGVAAADGTLQTTSRSRTGSAAGT